MEQNHNNESKPSRLKKRQRGSMRFKTRLLLATASILFIATGVGIVYLNLGVVHETKAAVTGDYRSLISGNWGTPGTWEKYNGSIWVPALTAPTSANGTITIQNGHTVTVIANVSTDQVVVETGAVLNINTGTFSVANGTGSDLDISGTVNQVTGGNIFIAASALVTVLNGGTYNYSGGTRTLAGWAINNGGTYVHNVDNINLPTATWGATSTLKVTGVTVDDLKGLNQTFGNIIYNCPSQTGIVEFWESIVAIAGDFTVQSTGTGSIYVQRSSTAVPLVISGNYLQTGGLVYGTKGAAFTMNINGTFTIDAGTFVEVERYGMPVMNIYGVFTINGGTFNHSTYLSNLANEGIGTVNLYNDYIRNTGLHTETATLTGHGEFNFAKSGTQTFTYSGGSITNTVNFTVNNGAILDLADYSVTGGGTFTLSSGGGLILASANGITSTGASGNVQVTGTRSYSTGGDYTYNGTSAQVTGNGLPATIHNLTIDNANDVTLTNSSSATSIITLNNGRVITGSKELGITNTEVASVVNYSTDHYVVGNLRRSVATTGSYAFPVGTMSYYELAQLDFTSMTGITNVLGTFINANPINPSYPLSGISVSGTSITEMLDYGYWVLTPNNPMSGGTYGVTLNEKGHSNPASDPHDYTVLKRNNASSSWGTYGTHTNSTQSENNGVATAYRSDLNAFSHFGIGKGSGPLPVSLIEFDAKFVNNTVVCNWQTVAEVNNDYFSLERSKNGEQFTEIARITGAGTSSNGKKYSHIDVHPLEGISYYRLKQVDYDGHWEMFHTVSVNRKATQTSTGTVRVVPNPVVDDCTVMFEAEQSGAATIVVSTLGGIAVINEVIHFDEGKNSIQLSFPATIKAGPYVLRVVNDALALPAVKIVKK